MVHGWIPDCHSGHYGEGRYGADIGIAEKYVSGKNFCLKDENDQWYDAGPEAGGPG